MGELFSAYRGVIMSPSYSLKDIAANMSKKCAIISDALKLNNLPQSSFDVVDGLTFA